MKAGAKYTAILLAVMLLCSGAAMVWHRSRKKEPVSPPAGIWEMEFTFEKRSSGELLHALVDTVTENGADVTIRKRNGLLNDPDTIEVTETYSMDRTKYEALVELLRAYPLNEIVNAPRKSSFGGNIGMELRICEGEKNLYIGNLHSFPDGLPPMRELLYTELYNFFNAIASSDDRMDSVRTEQMPDPRTDPKYSERTVLHFGREVSLVPGTGYDNDYGAEIDYGDKKWWIEDGYVGEYVMTDADKNCTDVTESAASFVILEDGTFRLTINDILYTGTLPKARCYKVAPGGRYKASAPGKQDDQSFSFDFNGEYNSDVDSDEEPFTAEEELNVLRSHIYLECHSEPHPHVREPRYMEMTRVC